jgi:hypothetical protein
MDNGLRNLTLIRASEAAVLYTLHHMGDRHLAVGNILLVCDLQEGDVSCTGENVVSLKPFKLKQLGPAEGKWCPLVGYTRFEREYATLTMLDRYLHSAMESTVSTSSPHLKDKPYEQESDDWIATGVYGFLFTIPSFG